MMKGGHKRGRNGLGEGHRGKMIAGVSICQGGLVENMGCSSSSGTSVKRALPTDGTNVTSCMNYEARTFLVGTKGFFYSTPFQINCICPLPSVVSRTFEQKSYSSSQDL